MKTASIYKEIGKNDYFIAPLQGRKREIVQYAETIASLDPGSWNQYVIAFGYTDEPLWLVNPGDTDIKDIISWDGVKRVEIWDYSTEVDGEGREIMTHGHESMYYATGKAFSQYMESRGITPDALS